MPETTEQRGPTLDPAPEDLGEARPAGRGLGARLRSMAQGLNVISFDGWAALAVATILAGLGLSLGYVELLIIASILLVAWAVAVVLALRGSTLTASRFVTPSRVREGDPARALLTVTNTGRLRAPPSVVIEQFDGGNLAIPLPAIPAQSEHVHQYLLDTSRRGRFQVGPLRIGRTDPFRFVRAAHAEGERAQLVVHPVSYVVPPLQSGRIRDLEGAIRSRRAQGGVAFHNLREYMPGDDRRLIHWRSSAKTETLMVKHNVVTHEPSLAIVLDTSAVYSDDEAFEDAVRIATSLVISGVDNGFPTELHTTGGFGGFIRLGGDGMTKVLDLLASVRVGDRDPGLHFLMSFAGHQRRETTLGVVTGVPDPTVLTKVSRAASRFDAVNTIIVGDRLERSTPSIKGSFVMRTPDAETWARLWKQRFG